MAAGQTCEPFLLKSLVALRMDRRLDAIKQTKNQRLLCQATLKASSTVLSAPPCLFCGVHGPQHQEKKRRLVFLCYAFYSGCTALCCQHSIASERHVWQGLFVGPCARRTACVGAPIGGRCEEVSRLRAPMTRSRFIRQIDIQISMLGNGYMGSGKCGGACEWVLQIGAAV